MRDRKELNTTLSPQLQGAGVEGRVDEQTKPHPIPRLRSLRWRLQGPE